LIYLCVSFLSLVISCRLITVNIIEAYRSNGRLFSFLICIFKKAYYICGMANDKITIISDWIPCDFNALGKVIQLNRDALLIAQSDRLEWFDFFVTVNGVVMTKEVRVPSNEGAVYWWGCNCKYEIQVKAADLIPADNIENSAFAGACSPLRLN
jgi:hypothetical protein